MRLRSIATGILAAGALLALTAAPANAAPGYHHRHHHRHHQHCGGVYQQGGDDFGILNGTQIYAPVDLGLDLSHNALGLLGSAASYDLRHDDRHYCR